MFKTFRTLAVALALLGGLAVAASADTDAFEGRILPGVHQKNKGNAGDVNPDGRGRQTWHGLSLGTDFRVGDHPILISQLGVWDDNSDGLLSNHLLSLYDITGGTVTLLRTVEIGAGEGDLRNQYRFIDIGQSIQLAPGTEFAVVVHYDTDNGDSNGNSGTAAQQLEPNPFFNDGGGLFMGIGSSRYGAAGFPTRLDTGPFNRYHSGNFTAVPNPEPSTFVLIGGVLVATAIVRHRRRKARA